MRERERGKGGGEGARQGAMARTRREKEKKGERESARPECHIISRRQRKLAGAHRRLGQRQALNSLFGEIYARGLVARDIVRTNCLQGSYICTLSTIYGRLEFLSAAFLLSSGADILPDRLRGRLEKKLKEGRKRGKNGTCVRTRTHTTTVRLPRSTCPKLAEY